MGNWAQVHTIQSIIIMPPQWMRCDPDHLNSCRCQYVMIWVCQILQYLCNSILLLLPNSAGKTFPSNFTFSSSQRTLQKEVFPISPVPCIPTTWTPYNGDGFVRINVSIEAYIQSSIIQTNSLDLFSTCSHCQHACQDIQPLVPSLSTLLHNIHMGTSRQPLNGKHPQGILPLGYNNTFIFPNLLLPHGKLAITSYFISCTFISGQSQVRGENCNVLRIFTEIAWTLPILAWATWNGWKEILRQNRFCHLALSSSLKDKVWNFFALW